MSLLSYLPNYDYNVGIARLKLFNAHHCSRETWDKKERKSDDVSLTVRSCDPRNKGSFLLDAANCSRFMPDLVILPVFDTDLLPILSRKWRFSSTCRWSCNAFLRASSSRTLCLSTSKLLTIERDPILLVRIASDPRSFSEFSISSYSTWRILSRLIH